MRAESIHASVAFLLRHLPPNVQLAIATRADPPLRLGSLRAAAEVLEIRAVQLYVSVNTVKATRAAFSASSASPPGPARSTAAAS